jgi:hypothetical protein
MTPHTVNLITKWVFIGPWFLFAAWEIVTIVLRQKLGTEVKTISMEAKDLGSGGLTSIVFAWFGLGAHYWITWTRPVWSFPWLGVLFWALLVGFIVMDLATSYRWVDWPAWMRWARYTPLVAAFAVLCGWAFFPQSSSWTP